MKNNIKLFRQNFSPIHCVKFNLNLLSSCGDETDLWLGRWIRSLLSVFILCISSYKSFISRDVALSVGSRRFLRKLDEPRFELRQGQEIFLSSTSSILAVRLTQPHMQCVLGLISAVKSAGDSCCPLSSS
jgi:hypothetical protein